MKFFSICLFVSFVCTQCQGASLGSFFSSHFASASGSCEVSEWGPWSSRPISGCSTVTRTRTIIRQGRNCPTELSQSETRCGRPDAFETASSIGTSFLGKFSPEASEGTFGTASPPPVDLLFVLDQSGSIGQNHFTTVINHVQELIELFPVPIAKQQTRVSAISFSSANQIDIDFNFNACSSKDDCKNLVGQITYEGGLTHTTKALDKARNEAFTTLHGSRSHAHKVLFLITDGHSNGGGNIVAAADALKGSSTRAEIYCLGVTENINEDELKSIVSEPIPDHLFYYDSFSSMSSGSRYLHNIFRSASGAGDVDGGGFFGIGSLPHVKDKQPISIGGSVLARRF
ncbi:matrilin-3-like [Ptychodera flava]|uniref:matrilin-3-like n=1 Tax=Ptychodera flava TaxID=63121 RepID=UPI00396A755E